MLHSGLPVVIALIAFGFLVFSGLNPGWLSRGFLVFRIAFQAWLEGVDRHAILSIAREQSDPQWEDSLTIVRRVPGVEPWDWDEQGLDAVWRNPRSS